jgi:hypothetical protein
MKRVKLFVIQVFQGDGWRDVVLYKGSLREAMCHADKVYGDTASRIKRVRTPADFDKLSPALAMCGRGSAQTEWVN